MKRLSTINLSQLEVQSKCLPKKRQNVIQVQPTPSTQKNLSLNIQTMKNNQQLGLCEEKINDSSWVGIEKHSYSEQKTNQTIDCSLLQDKDRYLFSLKRITKDDYVEMIQNSKLDIHEQIKVFTFHEFDKNYDRIKPITVNFKPMTIQESLNEKNDNPEQKKQANSFGRFLNIKTQYLKAYPTVQINNDHKRSMFSLNIFRPDSLINIEAEHKAHNNTLAKALEKLEDMEAPVVFNRKDPHYNIYVPKPTTNYCFICHGHFEEYRNHIVSKEHKQNDKQKSVWYYIKDICKKVQADIYTSKLKKMNLLSEKPSLKKFRNYSSSLEKSSKKSMECSKSSKSSRKNQEISEISSISQGKNLAYKKNKKGQNKARKYLRVKDELQALKIQVSRCKTDKQIQTDTLQEKQLQAKKALININKSSVIDQDKKQQKEQVNIVKKLADKKHYVQQNKISILYDRYPKLVPHGKTQKKPKKPATVSMKLLDQKPEPKKKLQQKGQKSAIAEKRQILKNKIKQSFKNKFSMAKQSGNSQFKKKQLPEYLRSNKQLSLNEYFPKKQKLNSNSEAYQNQQEGKKTFVGLAKTRSQQKKQSFLKT